MDEEEDDMLRGKRVSLSGTVINNDETMRLM